MSTTVIPEDLFGLTITPLSRFERTAILQSHKSLADLEHQLIGGKKLCEHPCNWDYGTSLSGSVTCIRCKDLWHFRINAEHYRATLGEIKSAWTRILDRASCHCEACIIIQRKFFLG